METSRTALRETGMADYPHDWDILSGVGVTALAAAAARAIETNRPGGLVRDPFAETFVHAANPPFPMPTRLNEARNLGFNMERRWKNTAVFNGARSRFFDDQIIDSWGFGIRQVVILGAGLDARAFRLEWPHGCVVFEVDQPRVLDFKNLVLDESGSEPRCTRRVVPSDLRQNWFDVLQRSGFETTRPTTWLAEGLIPYLSSQDEQDLLDSVQQLSAPGSWLAVEYVEETVTLLGDDGETAGQFGFDLRSMLVPKQPRYPSFLSMHGWDMTTVTGSDLIRRYDPEPRPTDGAGFTRSAHYGTARLRLS